MGRDTTGYVASLRERLGPQPLIIVSAACAILDEAGRVLLQQRSDPHGAWGLPGGAMELGESPSRAAVRETKEETGLDVRLHDLLGVYSAMEYTYSNGDVIQALDLVYVAEMTGGALEADGCETLALSWFSPCAPPTRLFPLHVPMLEDLAANRRRVWESEL